MVEGRDVEEILNKHDQHQSVCRSPYWTVFLHCLVGPVLPALYANIEPLPPAVEVLPHDTDGVPVLLSDLTDVSKLNPK